MGDQAQSCLVDDRHRDHRLVGVNEGQARNECIKKTVSGDVTVDVVREFRDFIHVMFVNKYGEPRNDPSAELEDRAIFLEDRSMLRDHYSAICDVLLATG
ncbi:MULTISPECIES: hypothetical protein [unclassified Rhizobium]|uniref:hypothetical protein n=1 Tax=unclassified Rhizobium TaxID=2613769 RepID=UPI002B25BE00|nr:MULTISPECIES: hypothetical protein [unclassified Rhizobium]